METTLATRVADFLKNYPPFQFLASDDLQELAGTVKIRFLQPGEILFEQGTEPRPEIYVVRQGAIRLNRVEAGGSSLVDLCDEGDLLGLRPLLAQQSYALQATADEECLVYAIPTRDLEKRLDSYPEVAMYLARSFASGRQLPAQSQRGMELVELPPLHPRRAPVTCPPDTVIRDAASQMTHEGVGSILITSPEGLPTGIITDKDLRRRVATGEIGLDQPVHRIMSHPVLTVAPGVSVADVQIRMVRNRVHHLCVTEDGTDQSPALGILSEHDLLVVQGNNPAVLIRNIQKSTSAEQLKTVRDRAEDLLQKYLEQEVSIDFIANILSAINDAIIHRCLELTVEKLSDHPQRPDPLPAFCWLSLGSEGREEQLLRTDQDNALVYEDVPDSEEPYVQQFFLELAAQVNDMLQVVGFVFCPADMMARNPKWCQSLQAWKDTFARWIDQPTPQAVMLCTIFFDFRPLYGDRSLASELADFIFQKLDRQSVFLVHLAKNATQNPPPLSFFRNFVVERSGEHKDEFDIKRRAMMPLVDAARTLILYHQQKGYNNTIKRFELLAELEPQNGELYRQAAEAYELLLRYRTRQGLRNGDTGRYFEPDELSKMERLSLRNAFRPISDLQQLLSTRFQLGFMR